MNTKNVFTFGSAAAIQYAKDEAARRQEYMVIFQQFSLSTKVLEWVVIPASENGNGDTDVEIAPDGTEHEGFRYL